MAVAVKVTVLKGFRVMKGTSRFVPIVERQNHLVGGAVPRVRSFFVMRVDFTISYMDILDHSR
jgi:hypothetical protein